MKIKLASATEANREKKINSKSQLFLCLIEAWVNILPVTIIGEKESFLESYPELKWDSELDERAYIENLRSIQWHQKQLMVIHQMLNTELAEDVRLLDIMEIYKDFNAKSSPKILHFKAGYDFHLEDFQEFRQLVAQANRYFKPEFTLWNTMAIFHESIYQGDIQESITNTQRYLDQLIMKGVLLLEDMKTCYEEIRQSLWREYEKGIESQHHIAWLKEGRMIQESHDAGKEKDRAQDIKIKLRSLNERNFDHDTLSLLTLRLKKYLDTINDSHVLNSYFEDRSLAFILKIESLELVIKKLKGAKSIIQHHPDYLRWEHFKQSLSISHSELISQLVALPKENWMAITEAAYLRNFLSQQGFNVLDKSKEIIDQLGLLYQEIESDLPAYLQATCHYFKTNRPNQDYITFKREGDENDLEGIVISLEGYMEGAIYYDPKRGKPLISHRIKDVDMEEALQYAKLLSENLINVENLSLFIGPTNNFIFAGQYLPQRQILNYLEVNKLREINLGEDPIKQYIEFFLNSGETNFLFYDMSLFQFEDEYEIIRYIDWLRNLRDAGYHTVFYDNTSSCTNELYFEDFVKSFSVKSMYA